MNKVDFKQEKNYQFRLIDFLVNQRKNNRRGRENMPSFKLRSFPVFDDNLSTKKNVEELKKEIEELMIEGVIEVKDIETLENKKRLDNLDKLLEDYQKDEEIYIRYDRRNLEDLKDYLSGTKHKEKSKIKPLENLPENFNWKDIKIQISSNNGSEIEIYINNRFFIRVDHVRCGCYKNKDKIQNIQWEFLNLLAVFLEQDKNPTIDQFMEGLQKNKNSIEQTKSKLSVVLENLFDKQDPFKPYNSDKGYVPRFKLIPQPELRKSNEEVYIKHNKPSFNEERISDPNTTMEDAFHEVEGVGRPD